MKFFLVFTVLFFGWARSSLAGPEVHIYLDGPEKTNISKVEIESDLFGGSTDPQDTVGFVSNLINSNKKAHEIYNSIQTHELNDQEGMKKFALEFDYLMSLKYRVKELKNVWIHKSKPQTLAQYYLAGFEFYRSQTGRSPIEPFWQTLKKLGYNVPFSARAREKWIFDLMGSMHMELSNGSCPSYLAQ